MNWRRKVSCVNCGFLHWEEVGEFFKDESTIDGKKQEIAAWERKEMEDEDLNYDPYLENEETRGIARLACLRNQWIMLPNAKKAGYYSSIEEIIQRRKCVYYMKYIPGFNPEEHKELQREKQTRETIFKATLIGAIIGALAAIVAQIIYSILNTGD